MNPSRQRASGGPGRLPALVVGAGLMGRWHAHAIRRAGGRLVGVVDPDLAQARRLGDRHRGSRIFTDLDQALSAVAPEAVHVCSPIDTHAATAAAALDHGCHVLVEKPVTPSVAETEDLLAHAARVQRLLCPVHQLLFQRGTMRAMARLDDIGPVLHLEAWACSAGAVGAALDDIDRVALEILPHPLSLLEHLVPGSLARLAWDVQRPAAGEFRALGKADTFTAAVLISMAGRPTRNTLRILGARGTLHLDFFHGYHVLEHGGVSRARKIVRPFDTASRTLVAATGNLLRRSLALEPAYPGLRELVQRFYRAARTGGPPPISPAAIRAVSAAAASLAAHRSDGEGTRLTPLGLTPT
jgi:predicted dehydrogenase